MPPPWGGFAIGFPALPVGPPMCHIGRMFMGGRAHSCAQAKEGIQNPITISRKMNMGRSPGHMFSKNRFIGGLTVSTEYREQRQIKPCAWFFTDRRRAGLIRNHKARHKLRPPSAYSTCHTDDRRLGFCPHSDVAGIVRCLSALESARSPRKRDCRSHAVQKNAWT